RGKRAAPPPGSLWIHPEPGAASQERREPRRGQGLGQARRPERSTNGPSTGGAGGRPPTPAVLRGFPPSRRTRGRKSRGVRTGRTEAAVQLRRVPPRRITPSRLQS